MSVPNTKFHYHYRRTCMGIKCYLQKSNGKNVFPIIVTMGILLEKQTPLLRLLHLIHKGYNIPTIIMTLKNVILLYIMKYISLSWYDIPELVVPIKISLIEGCC
jgi:hypothetical protein